MTYTTFVTRPVKSAKDGKVTWRDEEIVRLHVDSNTIVEKRICDMARRDFDSDQGFERYQRALEAWRDGKDAPIDGTPLTVWGGASPAQQKACEDQHLRSVEDLAAAPDGLLDRIGQGARDLREKARLFMDAQERAASVGQVEELMKEIQALKAKVEEGDALLAEADKQLSEATKPRRRTAKAVSATGG